MNPRIQLLEFLLTLIDIQIKKYGELAGRGVGPDAFMNAQLVCNEVEDLLQFAEAILTELIEGEVLDNTQLISLYTQIKFYVEQEHTRGYAGWLLDKNNIHTPVYDRVLGQLEELKEIARTINIPESIFSPPLTENQKQCEHDSYSIAHTILDIAKKLKDNPDMELDEKIPKHVQPIIKKNARTRYCLEEFAKPIDELHNKCTLFLQVSELVKSTSILSKESAHEKQIAHKKEWDGLFDRYRSINPDSKLFSPEHEWYQVGKSMKPEVRSQIITNPYSALSTRKLMLFSGVAAGAVLIHALLTYFNQLSDAEVFHSTLN